MRNKILSMIAFGAAASAVNAQTFTSWTFEGDVTTPAVGTGTASLVGGTTATFATGFGGGRGWNTTTYAAQGAGNKTRGVSFQTSTRDYKDIVVTYDHRHSNTAANRSTVQYSLDGINFTDVETFTVTPSTSSGDTWYSRSVSLPQAANHRNNVWVRILATFGNDTQYVATRSTSSYGTSGTWRWDNVNFSGAPVPEPMTMAALGLGAVALIRRRKNSK